MNDTPRRVTGAFPQTPATNLQRRGPALNRTPPGNDGQSRGPAPLPQAALKPQGTQNANPLIPLHIIDAPAQRFYALGFYVVLVAWKMYDWLLVVENDSESIWLFIKWAVIDFLFIFGLREFRIPWLEFAQAFSVGMFWLHVVFDFFIMMNIGVGAHTGK